MHDVIPYAFSVGLILWLVAAVLIRARATPTWLTRAEGPRRAAGHQPGTPTAPHDARPHTDAPAATRASAPPAAPDATTRAQDTATGTLPAAAQASPSDSNRPQNSDSGSRPASATADEPPAAVTPVDGAKSRGPGPLQRLVVEHLAAHHGQEFSPSALAKLLDRSSGAVSYALDRLANNPDSPVTQTSLAPRRYTIPASTPEPATHTPADNETSAPGSGEPSELETLKAETLAFANQHARWLNSSSPTGDAKVIKHWGTATSQREAGDVPGTRRALAAAQRRVAFLAKHPERNVPPWRARRTQADAAANAQNATAPE